MNTVQAVPQSDGTSWGRALVNLVPLWMLSVAVMAEGFPRPPLPGNVAVFLFYAAVILLILLLVKGWMPFGLLLYSLVPIVLMMPLDELSTTYKTPVILIASLILTLGAVAYQRSQWSWRPLILLLGAGITILFASYAGGSYWDLTGALDLGRGGPCFPDLDCPIPFPWQEYPWWRILFRL